MKNLIAASIVALTLLTTGRGFAAAPTSPVKNIVLVHGAWADGSGWKGVQLVAGFDGN